MVLASCCMMQIPATAADEALPSVGDKATDFKLNTFDGKPVKLSDSLADGPVVLLVLRGFPGYQCPICSRQVGQFIASAEELAETKSTVIMVYPGPQSQLDVKAREFLKGAELPDRFHLLIDPDYKFTNSWHLRWDAPRETAYPSTFVINKDRVITFAKISKTHGDRADVKDVMKVLKP